MHKSAQLYCQYFWKVYGEKILASSESPPVVAEIGARSVNGSLREQCPSGIQYVGLDIEPGDNVDLVMSDPYVIPMKDASVDVVLSSSCFEHTSMFWLSFEEILRILKPNGLFYLNVPSNGDFHRYPVDCWRFYPDSGNALIQWGRRSGYDCILLESFIGNQNSDIWNDFVAVFLKSQAHLKNFPTRMLDQFEHYSNGISAGEKIFRKPSSKTEDRRKFEYFINQIKHQSSNNRDK